MDLHIKDVLKKYITQDKKIGDAYYTQKIRKIWEDEFSKSITSRTSSLYFNKGKLTMKVDSAALRNDLFNNRDQIKNRINKHLGEEIVYLVFVR